VRVSGFWRDATHVTNAEFAQFVKAIGYVTTAERKPDWETLKVQVPPGTPQMTRFASTKSRSSAHTTVTPSRPTRE
jgi:formylglycine-generating enzyme required for sulfatase activity